jgi:hypothetical protein
MSYYRYKHALSKEIANFKTELSGDDIALAEQMLENRLTRDRVNAAKPRGPKMIIQTGKH